jgi:hypothetical protein
MAGALEFRPHNSNTVLFIYACDGVD